LDITLKTDKIKSVVYESTWFSQGAKS